MTLLPIPKNKGSPEARTGYKIFFSVFADFRLYEFDCLIYSINDEYFLFYFPELSISFEDLEESAGGKDNL